MPITSLALRAAALAVAAGALACASRPTPAPSATTAADGTAVSQVPGAEPVAAVVGQPLAALAGERVVVLPVQRSSVPAGGASGALPPLAALDSAIAAAVGGRGVNWAFADAAIRSARRNPTYTADPQRLAVGQLLPGRKIANDGALGDPLASQLRTLVALNDARYALVPAELRVDAPPGGQPRAVLRVALVDARAAQLRWFGDVPADAAPASGAGDAAATLARRLADLIAAP